MSTLALHVAARIRDLCRLQMADVATDTGATRAMVATRRLFIGMAGIRCGGVPCAGSPARKRSARGPGMVFCDSPVFRRLRALCSSRWQI